MPGRPDRWDPSCLGESWDMKFLRASVSSSVKWRLMAILTHKTRAQVSRTLWRC